MSEFHWLYWPSLQENGREYSEDEIIQHSSMYSHNGCGVYFLLFLDEIVYVGQTTDLRNRLKQHWESNKGWNRYFVIRCEKEDLLRLESYYILRFRPKYNIAMPKGEE